MVTNPWPRRRGLAASVAGLAMVAATALIPTQAIATPGDPLEVGPAPIPAEFQGEPHYGWFIQLDGEPTIAGGSQTAMNKQRDQLQKAAKDEGIKFSTKFDYRKTWNGLATDLSATQALRLAEHESVRSVMPIMAVDSPEKGSQNQPALEHALKMTGADVAQSELGFTGAGVKVGVIDSGVDYDHADFGGGGIAGETAFPTERVSVGYDFVGDDFNANPSDEAYNPEPTPDNEPDDCGGHGTHVAGIVGASSDERTGVAPEATIGAYRVFGCDGSTTSDIMLAAMERATSDGMDVVNMSIGSAFSSWPQYPTARAADAMADAGVIVVASIGNEGDLGTWANGAPGVGNKTIGVASFDNTNIESSFFTISDDDRKVAYSPGSSAPEPPTEGTTPVTPTGTPESTADACTASGELPDLSGSIALIQRGGCSFWEKAHNAEKAGASGVVIYNNAEGIVSPSLAPPVAGDPAIEIPVVAVVKADGLEMHSRATGDGLELTWAEGTVTVENPTGGLISDFSSLGVTAELGLKPDIGAPGGLIESSYPLEQGGVATISGTSMAAPHVAGAIALLLEARPDIDRSMVRDLLQNNAEPADFNLAPNEGLVEAAHRQGAGLMKIDQSIQSDQLITPGKLSLGESEAGPATQKLTLTNDSDKAVTYSLSNAAAVSTGPLPTDPSFNEGGSTVKFSADKVTVPAGGSTTVTATITAPAEPNQGLYGGYLIFTPDQGEELSVPYAGFIGDYQSVTAMGEGSFGFPLLGELTECDRLIGVDCVKDGAWAPAETDGSATFSMADGDVPTVMLHLEYPVRKVTVKAYKARPDGSRGPAVAGRHNSVMEMDYVGRNATAGGFHPLAWDGTRIKDQGNAKGKESGTTVRDGRYILEVTVLKALGDSANPNHVETWSTPAFTIDRSTN